MMDSREYWEKCWQDEDPEALQQYLAGYCGLDSEEINLFRQNGVRKICDAACGFGAYTLAFASNGFEDKAFDISQRAVNIARAGLAKFGFGSVEIKTAEIKSTGYDDGEFDAVLAHCVIDHMTQTDAQKAIAELYRITRKGGLILVSFDTAQEEDFIHEHELLPDGSMKYTGSSERAGMIFRPYDWNMILELLGEENIMYRSANPKGEQIAVISK